MERIERLLGALHRVHVRPLPSPHAQEPFLDLAARFAADRGTVLLMSGGDLDCARHHILGVLPALEITGRHQGMTVTIGDQPFPLDRSPWDLIREILQRFALSGRQVPGPLAAGLMGYLSYDLKDAVEDLPRTSVDDQGLPRLCLFLPSAVVVRDRIAKETWVCVPEFTGPGAAPPDRVLQTVFDRLEDPPPPPAPYGGGQGGFSSNFTRKRYLAAVGTVRDYIAAGDVYQVNLSQRFGMDFTGDPFSLFRDLFSLNPAPFFAYIQAGDHRIISTSPERFIRMASGRVETRPIKGTRPRGEAPEEDQRLRRDLAESRKDDAELSMIVDLLRNDIGKVCRAGSVRVTDHKRLEAYRNVWHLVSIVEGELAADRDAVDLVRATFPGGSITGCPKIRAMEIIDELEPNRRHIYTGSIGYLSFHDTLDLSIAIRTATVINDRILFSVGGGIVYDSDPGDEYAETLHKGRSLMEVFGGGAADPSAGEVVWLDGTFMETSAATVPAACPGFAYGFGFFETIRVVDGAPRLLDDHLDRFHAAWRALFRREPPDLTWTDIIGEVLRRNSLTDGTAALKITAAKGERSAPPLDDHILVTARPYLHRLATLKKDGIDLAVYPHPRQSPLADHKTLNYLFYLLAGRWASENGADEALILNPDGSLSETNTANLLWIRGGAVIRPRSPHVLPGVMEKTALGLLSRWGYRVERRRVFPGDPSPKDGLLLTNALMGAVPVNSLGGVPWEPPADLCSRLNRNLL